MIPPSPLSALALALLCDAVTGEPDWLYRRVPHPVVLIGRLIGGLDRAWNQPGCSDFVRLVRGGFAIVVAIGISGAIGMVFEIMLHQFTYGWLVEAVLMSALIAQRSLYLHVRDVAVALGSGGIEAGRDAVGRIVGRKTASLDESGVSRGAIESLAENFSDGVVAPVFWAAFFGLPGLLAYKALNTADSMIGHRDEKYLHFGRIAARMDDIANFIPARISGLLIAVAACFMPQASPVAGLRTMVSDAKHHRSINAGYPEAAMAGVLGIRLSGPRAYSEETIEEPWVGAGGDAQPSDIFKALGVFTRACILTFLLVVAGAVSISYAL
jgi:adenosylcobinamide-phosphate synthase